MFRYCPALLIIGMSVGCLFAAAGDEHSFQLDWQKEGFRNTFSVDMDRAEPFTKEPDFAQREILRGTLEIGHSEQVGFAWDSSESKLYIDLNRDDDLTNDPNGVLLSDDLSRGGNISQNFSEFPLSISTSHGKFDYRLKASLRNYSSWKHAEFVILSGYKGMVQLPDQEWAFRVVVPLDTDVSRSRDFSISSITKGSLGNRANSLPLPESVFLNSRCYDLEFEFREAEDNCPDLWCVLTEKEVPLAQLRIESPSVNQLAFGNHEMLILPPLVDEAVSVPAGDFYLKTCSLKYQEDRPGVSPQRIRDVRIKIAQEGENVLKIGAPFQNTVRIERMGKVLKFHYELKGTGGEIYSAREITGYDDAKKPSVAIYKGDMQLATGEFEYG